MALNAYLRMKGQVTGEVKGSVTQRGREGRIMVIAATHGIESPRDPHSGLPTGMRLHQPFTITKESDKSSPVLYNLLVNNETIIDWELQFWSPSPSGQEIQTHTVKLLNANISSINFCMPNNKDPELMRYVEYEQVAFCYQKIIWTWNQGGITAADDWEAPVA